MAIAQGLINMRTSETPDEINAFSASIQNNDRAKMLKLSEKELAEIVTAHQNWLESRGDTGCLADLRRADLAKADLSHTNLSFAILQS